MRANSASEVCTSSRRGSVGKHVSIAESDTIGAAGLDLAASELLGVEPSVKPVASQKFGVRPSLDNPTGLQDQDEVGAEDRGQTVRDGDRGALLGGVHQRLLYQAFAGRIQCAGGLVENQDAGIL